MGGKTRGGGATQAPYFVVILVINIQPFFLFSITSLMLAAESGHNPPSTKNSKRLLTYNTTVTVILTAHLLSESIDTYPIFSLFCISEYTGMYGIFRKIKEGPFRRLQRSL